MSCSSYSKVSCDTAHRLRRAERRNRRVDVLRQTSVQLLRAAILVDHILEPVHRVRRRVWLDSAIRE